jgi:hypothetical protein
VSTPKRYRYLTRSYVEWLGLEPTNVRYASGAHGGTWGRPQPSAFLVHDGGVYEPEDDGLAYRLKEYHVERFDSSTNEIWSAWVAA